MMILIMIGINAESVIESEISSLTTYFVITKREGGCHIGI